MITEFWGKNPLQVINVLHSINFMYMAEQLLYALMLEKSTIYKIFMILAIINVLRVISFAICLCSCMLQGQSNHHQKMAF